jgi:hypothetical protein
MMVMVLRELLSQFVPLTATDAADPYDHPGLH